MKKKPHLITYANGSVMKFKNKSVTVTEHDNCFTIDLRIFDKEHANKPACLHTVHHGKVRHTSIKLSEEAVKAICSCYISYQQNKLTNT